MANKKDRIFLGSVVSLALLAAAATDVSAEPGVLNDRIVFGQSAALDGPAEALGQGIREGILAAFAEANHAGGVGGRLLDLISYDDGYEPMRAIDQTAKLIDEDQVFALIGGVGTPTSRAAQPIATDAGVPYIGAFTGAGFLRSSNLTNVVNVRGSYDQETEAWIKHLTEDLNYDRIAILYQKDSFGRAGLSGVRKAMKKRGLSPVAKGTYKRNTVEVDEAFQKIHRSNPQAVVTVGAYKPIAAFIKRAREAGMNSVFVNISFVGSKALAQELGPNGRGVVITQVVPFPWDTSLPLVERYQRAIKATNPKAEFGFVSLEGYMVGRLTVMALQRMQGQPTRANLLKAITGSGPFDLGGVILTFGPGDNQGMDRVFLTVIKPDGSFRAVNALDELG